MEQDNTLDYLLQVEAKAALLVKDAQEEADRRIRECEEKNRYDFEERCKEEIRIQEDLLKSNLEKVKKDYEDELNQYRRHLFEIKANGDKFSALINEYLSKG